MAALAGATACTALPTLTPTGRATRLVDAPGGGVPPCSSTPTAAEARCGTASPTLSTTLNVLAAPVAALDVPVGVTTVTVRGPGAAVAAISIAVVSRVPSLLTVGARPATMPPPENASVCASCRLRPRTRKPCSVVPAVPKIGSIETISGCACSTPSTAAPGCTATRFWPAACTVMRRGPSGASAATMIGTLARVPSASTLTAPSVMPVAGVTSIVRPEVGNPMPPIASVPAVPTLTLRGAESIHAVPLTRPTAALNSPCGDDGGGALAASATPTAGEKAVLMPRNSAVTKTGMAAGASVGELSRMTVWPPLRPVTRNVACVCPAAITAPAGLTTAMAGASEPSWTVWSTTSAWSSATVKPRATLSGGIASGVGAIEATGSTGCTAIAVDASPAALRTTMADAPSVAVAPTVSSKLTRVADATTPLICNCGSVACTWALTSRAPSIVTIALVPRRIAPGVIEATVGAAAVPPARTSTMLPTGSYAYSVTRPCASIMRTRRPSGSYS